MQVPAMLQGESLKRLLQGAAAGAVATIFVGFYWGGWSLGSTSDKMAKARSAGGRSRAGTPCAPTNSAHCRTPRRSKSRFRRSTRGSDGTNSPLPGDSYPSSALVDACYTLLLAPKSAADDKLSIAAYTFKLLTEEQRRAIYTALKAQPAGPAFNADIGVELPSSVELRPMAGRRRRPRAADQGLSLRRGGQSRAVGVAGDPICGGHLRGRRPGAEGGRRTCTP